MSKLLSWLKSLLNSPAPVPAAVPPTPAVPLVPVAPPVVIPSALPVPPPSVTTDFLQINDAGLELIKGFEGCSLTSYPDDASPLAKACGASRLSLTRYEQVPGWQGLDGTPWTIGWGATGVDIVAGLKWTQARCDARLIQELQEHERYVQKIVTAPLTSNQHAALTSFTYNCGPTNLKRLVTSSKLNENFATDPTVYQTTADIILKYDKAQGQQMLGLTRRRLAERTLFLTPEV